MVIISVSDSAIVQTPQRIATHWESSTTTINSLVPPCFVNSIGEKCVVIYRVIRIPVNIVVDVVSVSIVRHYVNTL